MRIGFVGGSYTAQSTAVADEECINFYAETVESQGAIVPSKSYGGANALNIKSYFGTPGLTIFAALPASPVRGSWEINGRLFVVAGALLIELSSAAVQTNRGNVTTDGNPVSIVDNGIQLLIVSAGRAYCFTLATDVLLDVTGSLVGVPAKVEYSDSYFIVIFQNSNEVQVSQFLNGTIWPGQLVDEPSVFTGNIVSIIANHRELWVFGSGRTQPYQDTGSAEIFDVIPGALIEKGCGATFSPCRLDNSVFWIDQDERGGRSAWRSNGYTPTRISTYAVELDLTSYATIGGMTSYSYQDSGHLFWVLYIPGAQWSWVYDVVEGLWAKRATWSVANATWSPHHSWNHVYAFGKHLVGDWASGNLYQMSRSTLTDNGVDIRRLRRTPTVLNEMERIYHAELTVDFDTGQGPQPPLTDGDGNPRQPQAMLRFSDNRGKSWSNEHLANCGFAGQYQARAIWRRLGQSRYRVYELSVTDPIPWVIVDAYLRLGA